LRANIRLAFVLFQDFLDDAQAKTYTKTPYGEQRLAQFVHDLNLGSIVRNDDFNAAREKSCADINLRPRPFISAIATVDLTSKTFAKRGRPPMAIPSKVTRSGIWYWIEYGNALAKLPAASGA
jgi:hypothetical protein